ncbi:hypothetical protein YC2023_101077 [Brassica napus]|uniref:(rape) hypothetical protein n=1 Tax=Brassica napus TaxID=3708 RepID=A0A816UE37_BRANA|nr:unnamed protein product [Brassica napus]
MENDFPVAALNWTLLSSDTKERWFKAFAEVKVTKNGRRFGYGTMDIGEPSGPSYATQSPDYKALYLETQTKLVQVTNKCDELSSQVEDAQYWSTVMRNMFPDHVLPSQAARQAATANNTFEA